MVEFKAVIANPKSGKSYQYTVTGHHANSLIGKRMGDKFDGIFVSLPGYKLEVTGGSDKDGFPMRKEIPGNIRKRVLVSFSKGYRPGHPGKRERRSMRGNTISPEIIQINMKIVSHGSKKIEDLLKTEES